MKCPICEKEYDGEYCEHCNKKSKIFDFEDEIPSEPVDFSIYQKQEDFSEPDDTVSKVFNFGDEDNIEPITDYNPYPIETQEENTDSKEEDEEKLQSKKTIIIICVVSVLLVLLTVFCVLKFIDKTENNTQETTVPTTVAQTTIVDTHTTPATFDEADDYYDYEDNSLIENYKQYLEQQKNLEDGYYDSEYGYYHKDSGFYYRETTNGIKITGFGKYFDDEPDEITIKIPSEINGIPVTDIDQLSSTHCLSLYTEYYYAVNNVYTTENLSTLNYGLSYDFVDCLDIKIIVPSSVRTIRDYAFSYSYEIDEIIIEDGTETIEENAFSECSSLKKITIPPSVTYMAECMAGLEYDHNSFYEDVPKAIEGFTIYGDYGSTAQEYADTHGITFEQR